MLGEKLKKLREEKEKSQKDLGDYLGISASAYGFYEQGQREPDIEKLTKLADYFGVSVDFLTGRTDNEQLTIIYKNGDISKGLAAVYEIPDKTEQQSLINLINSVREKHGLPKVDKPLERK